MSLSLTYVCGLAAMMYLTTCLMAAAVRWFHMCRPYDRKPRYYYPGRPFATAAWLSSLALLPYVLHPESADTWDLARLYFLPVTIFHFIILFFSYFGSVMQWKEWRRPTLIIGVPVALALLAAVVLAVWPGDQLESGTPRIVATVILYALGAIMTLACFMAMWVVLRWAGRFDKDDFSNPSDFPVVQARKWLTLASVNVVLCWTGALADSPAFLAVLQLLISVSVALFVITALHPHRNRPVEEPESEPEAEPAGTEPLSDEQIYQRSLSRRKRDEILASIRTVVEEQEAFLDPHLTLQEVADRSGYNRTYISGLVKSELGGFFDYVNRLRLAHVEAFLRENPDATITEAAESSGFSDRKAYYKVKSQLETR